MWAAGGPERLPAWTERVAYAERFGVEPHKVNPPAKWWLRLGALDHARAQGAARRRVEQYGLAKADDATARLYNELILAVKRHGP